MANPRKQKLQRLRMEKLGPVPSKPQNVSGADWSLMTDAAKRAKGKDCVKFYIPPTASFKINGKEWKGKVIGTRQEYRHVLSILSYRSHHDTFEINGQRKERVMHLNDYASAKPVGGA